MSGYRRPLELAVVHLGSAVEGTRVVYLALLPDGPISCLEGPAALVWEEAQTGPDEDLALRVAERAGVGVDDVRDDVIAFVAELVERGLLER